MLVCQAFVPPMVKAARRIGDQHRLGRGAISGVTPEVVYAALKAARHPLHALPRRGVPDGGRAGQCGEPRRDQDRALPGDAGRRSGKDGFVEQVAHPLCRAGRDRRRGRLPRRPAERNTSTARCFASTAGCRYLRDDRRRTRSGELYLADNEGPDTISRQQCSGNPPQRGSLSESRTGETEVRTWVVVGLSLRCSSCLDWPPSREPPTRTEPRKSSPRRGGAAVGMRRLGENEDGGGLRGN